MARAIENLEDAFEEMFDFITDLPSGLDGFESDFDLAFQELEELKATLTPPNEWVRVEDRLPELPKEKYCWVCVLGCRKSSKRCMPMFYERTVVRGKTVERWKDIWDRIANELPDYWMPLPAPPDRRPPEGKT